MKQNRVQKQEVLRTSHDTYVSSHDLFYNVIPVTVSSLHNSH